MKHGDDGEVQATLSVQDGYMVLKIVNPGTGVESHGRGLESMQGRAEHLGGTLEIVEEEPFTVRMSLPL